MREDPLRKKPRPPSPLQLAPPKSETPGLDWETYTDKARSTHHLPAPIHQTATAREGSTDLCFMASAVSGKERKIVVAVDEGEESMHALSWYLNNVVADGRPGDTLVLLHAKPTGMVYPSMDGTGYLFTAEMMATMDRCSSQVADSVIARAKQACRGLRNVKVETKVESGDPREVICEAVEKMGADTLVMGSHGYGPFKRAFMGSVSHHCAQNVRCPVLIVKKS